MADILTIAQAKVYQLALKKLFGVEPLMEIKDKTIRIYYSTVQLITVQKNYEIMVSKKATIQLDFLPVILPQIIKNSILPVMGIFGAGVMFGRE